MPCIARFPKIAALATAALLAACGGGGGGGGGGVPVTDAGFVKLALTDAPACGYNQINVTVQKVRVNTSATAADGDPGWWEIVLSPAQKIDLLSLTNGNVLELGQVQVPVGTYQQLSLVLDTTTPLANSVVPVGGSETALGMPAGLQSGLKIPINVAVTKDQTSDYVIDFDACNSVLRLGTSGNYDLSARLSVVQRLSATGQRVTGFVDPTLDPTTTRISVQQNGTIIRATNPDSTPGPTKGHFVLYPVPVGTYDLVISGLGVVPAVVTGVTVSAATSTDVSTSAAPISPPGSSVHTITGTVSTGTTPVDARVAIIKKFNAPNCPTVPTATTAGAPADATTGGLAYSVATGAPVCAAFVAGITPLVFSPDNTSPTGRYTVAVTAAGTTKTSDVDATTMDPAVSFTFP
ncbi:MAG TPA: DUF4382 domain-containing protein [Caldimonas sp.]|nr:DUF4382 domain-containing protein [Caldimonas sp.]HEX4236314.1 DUF4382 domain-containing protein [Caldimonas sp.]